MNSIWIILLVIAAVTLVVIIFRKIRPWRKKWLLFILTLVVMLFTAFQVLFPILPVVAVTGEYSVSQTDDYFNYPTTNDQLETSEGNREVPVTLWHPEKVEDINGKLILFSHGSFGVADSNDSLFNELASHGYVVASLSHPYHSFTTTLEDGSNIRIDTGYLRNVMGTQGSENLEKTLTDLEEWSQVHEDDIVQVLEQIQAEKTENIFLRAINPDEVILMGHSLGGTAVINLGRKRDDIVAVIALESPFSGDIMGINEDNTYEFTNEPYPVPMLNIYSDSTWDVLDELTLYTQNWNYINSKNDQYQNVHIEGSGHIGLTDMHRVSPILTNLIDGGLNSEDYDIVLKQINEAILPFLDAL